MNNCHQTIIVGGGLAGLTCGNQLAAAGMPFVLIEATDRMGGRVRTDHVDGFKLDHGFQVLLTAYPACRDVLDYAGLRLRPFEPGALIRQSGKFCVLGDPWRRPLQAIATATNPVGSLGDKLKIAKLRRDSNSGNLDDLYERPSRPTIDRLREMGFNDRMIDQFFRPFLGGVFLDESLSTSSRMLEFVFRMFAGGDIAIPADGMAAIPRQIADGLPRGSTVLGNSVSSITTSDQPECNYTVTLSGGQTLHCTNLVMATESDAAAKLLGTQTIATPWAGTTNLYYGADTSPDTRRLLMLRGNEPGPVQTAVVLSDVAAEYAPSGKSLISVSVDSKDSDPETGDCDALDEAVRVQLKGWFGVDVDRWHLLRAYRVPFGLPKTDLEPVVKPLAMIELAGNPVPARTLLVCGDHMETPSIQGAMNSGIRAASELIDAR